MIYTQVQKPLIPAQWYEILKLKKVEVIAQLTARNVSHTITTHIMTLKSKLYKLKNFVQSLTAQFNAIVGDDWTQALQESGKTLKEFKKDLLRKFHPDANRGCEKEANTISQIINGWEEPQVDSYADLEYMIERLKRAKRKLAELKRREREIELQAKSALSKLKTMKNLDEIERYLCSLHLDVLTKMSCYAAKDLSEEVKSLSSRIWLHKKVSCRTSGSYDHAKFEREWAKR